MIIDKAHSQTTALDLLNHSHRQPCIQFKISSIDNTYLLLRFPTNERIRNILTMKQSSIILNNLLKRWIIEARFLNW